MELIIIAGPPASGKMTVGQELKKLTGYKLFYNHLSLEVTNQFFDWDTPHFKSLDRKIRFGIFEEIAASDIKGLIFTIVWAFDLKEDEAYIDEIVSVFKNRNPTVRYVELDCDITERLNRNKHENRLQHKPSKRNIEFSNQLLLHDDKHYRMNTLEGELADKKILKIENTNLSAEAVAKQIIAHYGIKTFEP